MEPTSGKTIRLEEHYTLNNERADEVIAASRKNYTKKYEEPKAEKTTEGSIAKKAKKVAVGKNKTQKTVKEPVPVNKLKSKSIGK